MQQYRDRELYIEQVPCAQIADEYGTPCYAYSKQKILQNWQSFQPQNKASHLGIFYAMKANANLTILRLLAKQGAGFDAVSGFEIDTALKAGSHPDKIVFSGVGKSSEEIAHAIRLGICAIHVESEAELQRIQEIAAQQNKVANIAIRVNPNVTAKSHPYMITGTTSNKFGIEYARALIVYKLAAEMPHIKIKGIACHIGSQIVSITPFLNAIDQMLPLVDQLQKLNITLQYIDVGGGLGITYHDEQPPSPQQYVTAILSKLQTTNLAVHIEPGRAIIANAGVLLTRVEYLKTTGTTNFAIVDAAMNDLIRPALYQSYHDIIPVHKTVDKLATKPYTIVGPVCESGDFFGTDRMLQINANDLLVVLDCGAYGYSMSSNYNARPRCAEVLVDGKQTHLIRRRETIEQLWQNEINQW